MSGVSYFKQPSNLTRRLGLATLGLLLPALAACGAQDGQPFAEDYTLAELAVVYPGAEELLTRPPAARPEHAGDGLRIVSMGTQSSLGPGWQPTARPLHVTLLDDEPGAFELEVAGRPGRVQVRRASPSRSTPQIVDHTIRVGDPGADAETFFFATPSGVEELILAREPFEPIVYELDLPPHWRLRRATGPRPVVELVDAADVPRMRMVADRAWDAAGQTVTPSVALNGTQISLSVTDDVAGPVLIDPEWQEAGRPSLTRWGSAAALLTDGTVLIVGGTVNMANQTPTALTERFDPLTGVYEPGGAMTSPRISPTVTQLRDGRVLIAGGVAEEGPNNDLAPATATAELYDPISDTFTATASPMAEGRTLHSATRLHDGTVLIAGGTQAASTYFIDLPVTATADRFDPTTDSFTPVGELAVARGWHGSALLPTGEVLIAGGIGEPAPMQFPFGVPTEVELYDPASQQFSTVAQLDQGRLGAVVMALPEQDAVLIAGGLRASGGYAYSVGWNERYHVDTKTVSAAAELGTPRYNAAGALLPTGSVLMVGGIGEPNSGADTATDLYHPELDVFAVTDELPDPQMGAGLTLLPQGRVFATNGMNAALYDPAAAPATELAAEPMVAPRLGHTVTLLESGDVLVVGGSELPQAEIFDPDTRLFRTLPSSSYLDRRYHTATRLPDGRVLIVGGQTNGNADSAVDTTVMFTPEDESFVPAGALKSPRAGHTATLLPNGRVLVVGGRSGAGWKAVLATAEIYDPEQNSWAVTAELQGPRQYHAAAPLPDGRVLIVGGSRHRDYVPEEWATTAEVFEPGVGSDPTFTLAQPFQTFQGAAAAVLPDGRVLVVGQGSAPEIFDPATDTFTAAPAALGVDRPQTVLLPSGRVMMAGGEVFNLVGQDSAQPSVTLFDAIADSLVTATPMAEPRAHFAATLLPCGSVLLLGGHADYSQTQVSDTAELWRDGPAPAADWRPVVTSQLDSLAPHAEVTLDGHGFEGVAEASAGMHPSPTNHPVVLWMPLEGAPAHGQVVEFTDQTLRWRVPATGYAGPGLLFVIVNGIASKGIAATLEQVDTGLPCPSSGACKSGFCRDGVCCATDCGGGCEACSAALKGDGQDGECGPVLADTDPRDACEGEPLSTCGQTGFCDGAGHCQAYPEGTPCGAELACIEGTCRAGLCDGDHSVTTGKGVQDCSPFRCSVADDRCLDSCQTNSDCVEGYTCSPSGTCEQLAEAVSGCGPACAVGSGPDRDVTPWLLGCLGLVFAAERRRRRVSCRLDRDCSRG